jgi:hypothetical protein
MLTNDVKPADVSVNPAISAPLAKDTFAVVIMLPVNVDAFIVMSPEPLMAKTLEAVASIVTFREPASIVLPSRVTDMVEV